MNAASPERRQTFAGTVTGWPDTVVGLMAKHQRSEPAPKSERTRIALNNCRALARRERGALEFEVTVRDISLHGLGFDTREAIAIGQQFVVSFPTTEQRTAWLVEVRWTNVTDDVTHVGAEIIKQTSWKMK